MTLSELPGHQSSDGSPSPEEWSRFDHLATSARPDLASLMMNLSAKCPIGHSDLYGGFDVLTRAADIKEAAQQPELFRSQPHPGPGPGFPYSATSPIHIPMIGSDPPLHRDFRRPLQRRFSQASAEAMAPRIRAIVTGLIDEFIESGRVDFAAQLVIPMPTQVTGELLDLPIDRRLEFQKWTTQIVANGSGAEGYEELTGFVQDLYDIRRANPGNDIPSFILGFDIEGQPITRMQWVGMVLLLIMAGLDTTTNGGAQILHFLGTRPELRARLAADPDRLGDAVDELLRWVSPVPQHSRGVGERCEVGGHQFEKGDVVLLHWLAANRDPEEFPEPDVFIADRSPNRHYAFGVGAHRCLGSHLAKVELRVLLEEVLRRIPDYQIVDGGVTRYPGFNRGMSELQVTFTPGGREDGPAE